MINLLFPYNTTRYVNKHIKTQKVQTFAWESKWINRDINSKLAEEKNNSLRPGLDALTIEIRCEQFCMPLQGKHFIARYTFFTLILRTATKLFKIDEKN